MDIREFIRKNRKQLDSMIRNVVPNVELDDKERRLWVLNDPWLYQWARREGVSI